MRVSRHPLPSNCVCLLQRCASLVPIVLLWLLLHVVSVQ